MLDQLQRLFVRSRSRASLRPSLERRRRPRAATGMTGPWR